MQRLDDAGGSPPNSGSCQDVLQDLSSQGVATARDIFLLSGGKEMKGTRKKSLWISVDGFGWFLVARH